MVEGKNEEMSTAELSGGARIHYIFQQIFVKSLEVCVFWYLQALSLWPFCGGTINLEDQRLICATNIPLFYMKNYKFKWLWKLDLYSILFLSEWNF